MTQDLAAKVEIDEDAYNNTGYLVLKDARRSEISNHAERKDGNLVMNYMSEEEFLDAQITYHAIVSRNGKDLGLLGTKGEGKQLFAFTDEDHAAHFLANYVASKKPPDRKYSLKIVTLRDLKAGKHGDWRSLFVNPIYGERKIVLAENADGTFKTSVTNSVFTKETVQL